MKRGVDRGRVAAMCESSLLRPLRMKQALYSCTSSTRLPYEYTVLKVVKP